MLIVMMVKPPKKTMGEKFSVRYIAIQTTGIKHFNHLVRSTNERDIQDGNYLEPGGGSSLTSSEQVLTNKNDISNLDSLWETFGK